MAAVLVIVLGAMAGLVPIAAVGALVVVGVMTVAQAMTAMELAGVMVRARLLRGKTNEVPRFSGPRMVVARNGHEIGVRGSTSIVCAKGHGKRVDVRFGKD